MNPNDDTQNIVGLDENVKNEMGPEGGMPQPGAEFINTTAIVEKPSGGESTPQADEKVSILNSHQDEKDDSRIEEIREELDTMQSKQEVDPSIKIEPEDLTPELKAIYDPSFSTLGHGTRPEAARQILEQGLRAKLRELDTTTIPLFDASRSFEDQQEEVVAKITNWEHLDAKAVVVVMIPNPEEGELGGKGYFNSVFQELPESDTGYNDRYLIPPNYIRGYIDVESGRFIPNPKFKPEKLTVKINEITKPDIDRPTTPVEIPMATAADNDVPDIW